MLKERLHALGKNSLSYLSADLNGVISVSKNLRLNDGSKTVLLADSSISSEGVSGLNDGKVRWATIADLKHSAPLGKSGAGLVVLLASVAEAIKTCGGTLILSSWKSDDTLVNLDTWEDVLGLKEVNERGAVSSLLV